MNRTAFKFAASTMIVSLTMVTATAQSVAMRLGSPERANSPTDRQAAQLHEQAGRAMQQGQVAQALGLMENAVALSPRDAGYRLLLADTLHEERPLRRRPHHLCRRGRARSVQRPRRPQPRADECRDRTSAGRGGAARRAFRPCFGRRSRPCLCARRHARAGDRDPRAGRPRLWRDAAPAPESRSVLRPCRRLDARPHDRRAGRLADRPRPAPAAVGGACPSRRQLDPGRGDARRGAGPGPGPAGPSRSFARG